jgi:hypothetical protein
MTKTNHELRNKQSRLKKYGSFNDSGDPMLITQEAEKSGWLQPITSKKLKSKLKISVAASKRLMQCTHCKSMVKVLNMRRHTRSQHNSVLCPVCSKKVPLLKDHLFREHGISLGADGNPLKPI